MTSTAPAQSREAGVREVAITPIGVTGSLRLPDDPRGLVVFAHGSGSSPLSPRNNAVAEAFGGQGIASLLFDLLTPEEEEDRRNVFNSALLAERLVNVTSWIDRQPALARLPLGVFGASTGAAAALVAAAQLGERVGAVVSRGGRPDLAGDALGRVRTPTLLIAGGADSGVLKLNERVFVQRREPKALKVVPGATHLFPEPGALEAVIEHAAHWFLGDFDSARRMRTVRNRVREPRRDDRVVIR